MNNIIFFSIAVTNMKLYRRNNVNLLNKIQLEVGVQN